MIEAIEMALGEGGKLCYGLGSAGRQLRSPQNRSKGGAQ